MITNVQRCTTPGKTLSTSYPGPQKAVNHVFSSTRFLQILVAMTIMLFIQSIMRENAQQLHIRPLFVGPVDVWAIQVLDNKSAATLVIGLLSLAFVNRQITLAYRPLFNYRSQQTAASIFGLCKSSGADSVWSVNVQNVGSGPALVLKSLYRVSLVGQELNEYEEYDEVVRKLVSEGIVNGRDFVLRFFSYGWSLAAKDECTILECSLPLALKIKALDISVEFKGLLGDTYVKEIYCIPRMGIYPNNPHAPAITQKACEVKGDENRSANQA